MAVAPYPYEAEKVLQDLLKKHPKLLAGYQMDQSGPRRSVVRSQYRTTQAAPVTGG
jgi:hypothetical protein